MLLGAIVGILVGVPLGALFRPVSARLERLSRRIWRESPLIVHVEQDPTIIWSGAMDWVPFSTYFRELPDLSSVPMNRTDWLKWSKRKGGKDAVVTHISVTLQAKTDVAVVIEGVSARSTSREIEEGYVLTRSVGGADLSPRHFEINLDWGNEPFVTYLEGGHLPGETPSFVLAAGDVERFQIWATTEAGWHDWSVELHLLAEGRRLVIPINDNGRPFTTVGIGGLEHVPIVPGKK